MRPRDPDWWRYVWHHVRQGPTEVGYAYFRARRRRRNRADRDLVLSESDQLALWGLFDLDDAALAANAAVLEAYRAADRVAIGSVQWFMPYFSHAYFGGTYTILRLADHLRREHGVESRFCVYDCAPKLVRPLPERVAAAFPGLAGVEVTPARVDGGAPYAHLRECDAAIGTYWTSVYPLVHFRCTPAKFYFVQDYEAQFYAAGSASALVEQTYRLGVPGLVNTPGLADVYRSYGNPAVSFVPAVDTHRYHPPLTPRPKRPVRIFFYGRPTQQRNAFGLGLASLLAVKRRYGDAVDLVSAGDRWTPEQYGVSGKIRNLGILPGPEAVAALYRTCHIGLAFMLTAHPSYQPFEFMASGVATVSNDNPRTSWFLRNDDNALTVPPVPTLVAEAVGRLVEDADLRGRLAESGLADVTAVRWEDQLERLWRAMTKQEALLSVEPELAGGLRPPAPLQVS